MKIGKIVTIIIICVTCSAASFLIGFSIREDTENGKQPTISEKQTTNNPDSELFGLYVKTEYHNGNESNYKIYLNDNHDCNGPDVSKYSSCTWNVEDNIIKIVSYNAGGYSGKTDEECKKAEQQAKIDYNGTYKVINIEPEDREDFNGYICFVTNIDESKYEILSDGSLLGEHGTFHKKR